MQSRRMTAREPPVASGRGGRKYKKDSREDDDE
jgi:hypothetical protein